MDDRRADSDRGRGHDGNGDRDRGHDRDDNRDQEPEGESEANDNRDAGSDAEGDRTPTHTRTAFDVDAETELTYETVAESPLKRWLLLDGNRLLIAGLLAAGLYAAVIVLQVGGLIDITNADTVVSLYSALVGGTLPFITIVLAINQLVLSQELGWPNELTERFEKMTDFQHRVEAVTGISVSPSSPAAFLRLVVDATVERGRRLPDSLSDDATAHQREEIARFVETLESDGETVSDALADAEFGTFEALSAVLGHHQGNYYHAARLFHEEWDESFTETAPLEELIELLELLAIARQTFKTLYVQHELAILSRLLLYVGFPTLVGGGLLLVSYPTLVTLISTPAVLLAVAAGGVVLVFLPFVVLLSYALRIATIAARTADFGPFVPQSSP
ncbi:hypothetical protein C483_14115 [Natrialba hulunbeirensis JCM 10989]|uniref:Uncharacterized protein n=1 Tax=Natrialba hulunbeirensis JCM 10989 TaxID=1227493 RepID=L9ZU52_9EURY|nr:hypothetical protein [Natrialba hulunbeirensis]ELY89092.1 hypothetical protein C483_14115 [Natrialba hulunbeirensis JCM 10989]